MKKSNHTKKSLQTSLISLLLCLTMLVGTTFAWFTDSISNKGNIIQSGNLDIGAVAYDVDANGDKQVTIPGVNNGNGFKFETVGEDLDTSKNPIINETNWEPGISNAKLLEVKNNGSLATKIKLDFTVNDGGLQDALWFDFVMIDNEGIVQGQFTKRPMSQLTTLADSIELSLLNKDDKVRFVLVYGMNEEAGNEYQGKSFSADVTILATQAVKEADGFGNNQYDSNATYPVADATDLKEALKNAKDGDTIQLTGNIVLDEVCSISKNVTIDGNGKTVISKKPVYVGENKNVTFKNIEFTSPTNVNSTASSLYAENFTGSLTLENCKFVDFQWEAVQISPKGAVNIVVNNCYFSNSKTMAESNVVTNRYFHIEVADPTVDISNIRLQLTNNTFNNVVKSAANGNGCFKDSVITSYGVPKANFTCSGNVFTGTVQDNALNNPEIIWISDGRNANQLLFEGFSIKK